MSLAFAAAAVACMPAPSAPAPPAADACTAVTGEWILGRDLAAANPTFQFLDSDYKIGYVPLPGSRRVFTAADLAAIARRNGRETVRAHSLCFEYPTRLLTPADVMDPLRRYSNADSIEIVAMSAFPVVEGAVEIVASAPLAGEQSGLRLFRGRVRYGGRRTQSLWVRAICQYAHSRLVAKVDLEAGRPIQTGDVGLEQIRSDRPAAPGVESVDSILGLAPRRAMRAGAAIERRMLERPKLIRRGDRVRVEVRRGSAHLELDSEAETAGRAGDAVLLRNPETGRRFRAVVAAAGRAIAGETP
ncbi:MAG: flagellar basal body P-ring formation chaperone FlgA [Bryobacteraceae bacterium]